jgi:hypothetical protein
MMKISNHKEIERIKQELRPWLNKWRISLQAFDNLPLFQKILLHGIVYTGTITPSDAQLRTLYQNLGLGERRTGKRGQIGSAAVESVEHEELKEIFRLLSPSEMLPDLYKY